MTPSEVKIGAARLILGDCRDVLAKLPADSVHCCVTSPPYYNLRDYGVAGQIGLEPTPAAYIANLVEIMRQVRRVLRRDGTLWLVIGDCYASGSGGDRSIAGDGRKDPGKAMPRSRVANLKSKNLVGIPWRVAFALQDDGWILRCPIIWHKPNPMPESVTDRPTSAHEYLFLLTKSPRYFYDAEAIKETAVRKIGSIATFGNKDAAARLVKKLTGNMTPGIQYRTPSAARNKRSVWTIATAPFRGAHFATFPPALVEPCILAGTSERGVCPKCGAPWERIRKQTKSWREDAETAEQSYGPGSGNRTARSSNGGMSTSEYETIGWRRTCSCKARGIARPIVVDPFGGAATTALVASKLGRGAISIELSAAYHDIACERIAAAQSAAAA